MGDNRKNDELIISLLEQSNALLSKNNETTSQNSTQLALLTASHDEFKRTLLPRVKTNEENISKLDKRLSITQATVSGGLAVVVFVAGILGIVWNWIRGR